MYLIFHVKHASADGIAPCVHFKAVCRAIASDLV
jgi:hypothetical protein